MELILNVKNESILTKLKEFIDSFGDDIEILNQDIELLSSDDLDYHLIDEVKKECNESYSVDEVRKMLNDSQN